MVPGMTQPLGPIEPSTEQDAVHAAQVRAAQIAAIEALADFYRKHPNEPMPTAVRASSYAFTQEGNEVDRVLAVTEFADRHHGAQLSEDWHSVTATHTVAIAAGMSVNIVRTAHLDQPVPHRYVP